MTNTKMCNTAHAPYHRLEQTSFSNDSNELIDPKRPNQYSLHHDYVRGDVLRPPHGKIQASMNMNKI